MAEKYKVLILISSNRTYLKETLLPESESDVLETIGLMKKYYNVDASKIFLAGNCLGGKKALLMCQKYHGIFKAVAVTSPVYDKSLNFEILKKVNLFIQHDYYDTHTPVENSMGLIKNLKKSSRLKYRVDNYFHQKYFWSILSEDDFKYFDEIAKF